MQNISNLEREHHIQSFLLLCHLDVRVKILCKLHKSLDSTCLVSVVQTAGVMVWRIVSWHTLGSLVLPELHPKATPDLLLLIRSTPLPTQFSHLPIFFLSLFWHHGCAPEKKNVMASCLYGPAYLRNSVSTLFNLCLEDLNELWQKGVQSSNGWT